MSQYVIYGVQALVLGGVQDFQILLDRRPFLVATRQLVIRHAEARRGIEVIYVFVIHERAGFSNQGIDHVPKVDEFFALSKQPRQAF